MATFKDGINGPFRGKVGSVVGYQWKGIWVMRSLPRPIRNRKWSERQLANHAKMRIMQEFLGANQVFVRRGFGLVPEIERMSAYNAAMSYNKKNAIKGEFPDLEIDYNNIVFAKGNLPGQDDIEFKQHGGKLEFTWVPSKDNSARKDDQIMILLTYKGQSSPDGIVSGARRYEGKETVSLIHLKSGIELHIYVAFIADDRKQVSDSMYLGSLEVQEA